MATSSLALLDKYVHALRLCLDAARDSDERNNCFERLSSAGAMRIELEKGNIAAACAILSDEERSIGWGGFYGPGGESVHCAFVRFAEQVKTEVWRGWLMLASVIRRLLCCVLNNLLIGETPAGDT